MVCFLRRDELVRAGKDFRLEPGDDFQNVPYLAPPWYVQSRAPERPTLGPRFPVIDTILKADKRAIPKERHIAKQIVEGLWTYTVVKGYVWITRLQRVKSSCCSPVRRAMRKSI
jgi:hypothetical protein